MTISIGVKFDENLITPLRHKQLMESVLRWEMTTHKNERLMQHFALGANRKYGYQPITAGYSIMKKRVKGHLIPLVFEGRLRDVIKSSSRVTATSTRSRLYAKGYFPMPDWFRSQIEKILPEELAEMSRNIGRHYVLLLNSRYYARKRSSSKIRIRL